MANPQTPEEWMALAATHEAAAKKLKDDKIAAFHAVGHIGFATEAALKAYIIRKERFNAWPSRASRPDLYTHDLRKLRAIAGIAIDPTDPMAACWHWVLQWDRISSMIRALCRSASHAIGTRRPLDLTES